MDGILTKTKYVCLLSFLTAAAIFAIVIMAAGTYPFGDMCILRTDMYHQYAPFMAEFAEKVRSGSSLKFTWNLGLGVNFRAIMSYYLASPLNVIAVFLGQEHTIEYMALAIILKAGLSGAVMAFYLSSHAKECGEGLSTRMGLISYLLSLFYALSGYMCAYYWNIMWMDAVAVFPLVMLGEEEIVKGSPAFLPGLSYGLALGFCIFTNYYISIFICIFAVIYFFSCCIVNIPESPAAFFKAAGIFAAWSLMAGGISACMLLPEIYAFKYTVSSTTSFPTVFSGYFSIIRELSRHLPLIETEQGLDHWPNIYCGSCMLPLYVLYLRNRRIPLREKAVYTAIEFFLLASFSINVLNFMWHGMHYPNSLPARQSFIYIFLMVFMGWRVLSEIDSVTKKDLGCALLCAVVFILCAQEFMEDDDAYGFFVFYIGLIAVALYAGVIHVYRKRLIRPLAAGVAAAALVILELSANTAYTSITTTSRKSFTADNADVKELVKTAHEDAGEDKFIRIERSSRKSKNDGAWLSFPSASIFSSMANSDGTDFYKSLGMEASVNAYSITGSTPLADMLLGVGYEITASSNGSNSFNDFVAAEGDSVLYKNKYTLGLAYMMPEAMQTDWERSLGTPALVQNNLCDVLGLREVLVPVYSESDASDGEFSVTISEDGLYYAYEANEKAGDITVRWTDRKKTFQNLNRNYFIELGELTKGELITFKAEENKDPEITIYEVDEDAMEALYLSLGACQMEITEYGDDYVKGTVLADPKALGYVSGKARMLVTTPYDEGWKVYVDGEETEISKGLDTFLSFYVEEGTHEVAMYYNPKGAASGTVISIISLLLVLAAAVLAWRKKKNGGIKDPGEPLDGSGTEFPEKAWGAIKKINEDEPGLKKGREAVESLCGRPEEGPPEDCS